MRCFMLVAASAAFLLAAMPARASTGAAPAAVPQEGRTDVGLPAGAGGQFWESIPERLTVPLGPAYPNYRPQTWGEYWVAAVCVTR